MNAAPDTAPAPAAEPAPVRDQPPVGALEPAAGSALVRTVLTGVERFAVPGILVVLVIVFSTLPATSATFPTHGNIQNLLSGQAVQALLALGALLPIIAGQYDLSVGAVLGASSLLSAGLMARHGIPPLVAVLLAIVFGLAIGLVNGYIVAYLEINSLIVTTGTATVISGFVLWYSKSQAIVNIPESVSNALVGNVLGIPKVHYGLAVVAVLVWVLLQYTPYGRYLHAVGSNPRATTLVGLDVRRLTLGSMAFSGALAGLAGAVELSLQGNASPQLGPGFTLPALSAVFLGSTTIRPGRFNVVGTVVAVYLVALIVNGLTLAGASDWVQPTFNGLALLGAVVLAAVVARKRARGRRRNVVA